ncbi:MAG: hypothetical protein A2X19_00060 [Bacteroidetes bacterium GWE2_39_28]|nr:MAG: hypothetical protein A2X19_00060 [Bacteroidetes bacterium GWE2_39_28]OFY14379.1 MAG: hypothetical protein A2X16_05360 [Bacteroidetes bacterium GWF2_39_10]OFZ10284.1 MAG: hypothetical protein A2465_03315 [Bacteroidetes bacterium RIFOXYC2_FULL_39_11]HCT95258.1 hypothetical protein [Rikenellaceae bacterium]
MYQRLSYIILTILLLSCSKSETPVNVMNKMSVTPYTEVMTKSLVDNISIREKSVGIQITDFSGTSIYENNPNNNIARLKYTTNWLIDDGADNAIDVILTSLNAKIYGWYPYSTEITGTGESAFLSIDIAGEREPDQMTDYLWCAQSKTEPAGSLNINCSNPDVNLRMNHALSLIAFVIYKDGYEGDGVLSKFEIIDNSITPSIRVNKEGINNLQMKLTDGSITGGDMVSNATVNNINSTISLSVDPGLDPAILFNQKNCHILFPPMSINNRSNLEFRFYIDGLKYYVSLEGSETITYESGNIYVYKAKLSPRMIDITGVVEWQTINYEVGSGYN